MDDIDQRLLGAIAVNARMPVKDLAAEAGISREVADYRIKRLEKKVIKKYSARIHRGLFHSTHMLLARFRNLPSDDHILGFLRKTGYPQWIGRTSGKWDVLLIFSVTQLGEVNVNVETFSSEFGDNIEEQTVLTITEESFDDLLNIFGRPEKRKNERLPDISLDDIDRQIIDILVKDAKIQIKDIAAEVNLTPEAVSYRMKKLEENKVLSYLPLIDFKEAGMDQYFFLSKFRSIPDDIDGKMDLPKAFSARRTIGNYDIAVGSADRNEVEKMRSSFGDHIRDFDMLEVDKVLFESASPEGILA